MSVPIVGKKEYPYIIVSMHPGIALGTFDIQLDTQHFPGGAPLAAQCLLQATMFLLPQAFQAVAEKAIEQLLNQQRIQGNGST